MGKHDKLLAKVFAEPVSASIKWREIEAMLIHFGATIEERAGSRVCATLNGVVAVFHRPHPSPDTKKGAVRAVRLFLIEAGITP